MLAQSVAVEIDAMDVIPVVQHNVLALDEVDRKQAGRELRTSLAGD